MFGIDTRMIFDTDGKSVNQKFIDISSVNANAEVLAARGTYPTLAPRLDNVDASLADKAQKADLDAVAKNLESFRTSGMTDDTLISTAITNSTGKKIVFPFNKTYNLTQSLSIPFGSVSLDLNGSTLNFSPLTSGYAIQIIPSALSNFKIPLTNGYILGANNVSNNTDGIFIGQPSGQTGAVSQGSIEHITIDGFRDNIYFGNQTWCITLRNVFNVHFWRYAENYNTVTNAGENIRHFGGTIANGKLGAVAVYTGANINPDVYFHSTSFDYTDSFFNVSGGHYGLYGCHLENNNNNPMIKVNFTAGNSPISFGIFGGTMGTGPGTDTSSPESANGRPWFVELTGDKIAFSTDNVSTYLYNKSSEIVHIDSGSPQVTIRSPHVSPKGGNPPDISGYTNQLFNGDFESATAFQGWNQNTGTGYTIALDTTTKYSGTQSASIASATGTTSGSLVQDIIGLTPGKMLLFSGYFKSNLTVGYFAIRLQMSNAKGDIIYDQILTSANGCQITGVTDWTRIGMSIQGIVGAVKATMQIYANGINGTVWADKMQAWVV